MSYDFTLCRRRIVGVSGDVPLETGSIGSPTTPPDPAAEDLKQKIVSALQHHDSNLVQFRFDFKAIADFEKITEEQARANYRHFELNDEGSDNTGIQITVNDASVWVTVPFWHTGSKAEMVFQKLWKHMEVIAEVSGYTAYDDQIEPAELDLRTDFNRCLRAYEGGMRFTRNSIWKILLKHGWRLLFSRKSKSKGAERPQKI